MAAASDIAFRDRPRRWANLLLAPAMPVTTALAFATGVSFDDATRIPAGDPPIVPAAYAFAIWTLIYGGSVVFGIYQALPSQAANPLLRRIGWATAVAFGGTCAWLVAARLGLIWATFACILIMFAALLVVVREFVAHPMPFRSGERWFVVRPLIVFAGWVSLAVFANFAAALRASGLDGVGFSSVGWTVLLLTTAGVLGAVIAVWTRGSVAYAGTLVWGLVAIAVANLTRERHPAVAWEAAAIALLVCVAAASSRRLGRWRRPTGEAAT